LTKLSADSKLSAKNILEINTKARSKGGGWVKYWRD